MRLSRCGKKEGKQTRNWTNKTRSKGFTAHLQHASEHLVELNFKNLKTWPFLTMLCSDSFTVYFYCTVLFRWRRHLIVKCVVLVNSPVFSTCSDGALVQEFVLNRAAHWLLPAVKILSVPQGADGGGLALLHQSNPQCNPIMKGAANTKHLRRDQFKKYFRYCVNSAFSGLNASGEWVHTACYSVWCCKRGT